MSKDENREGGQDAREIEKELVRIDKHLTLYNSEGTLVGDELMALNDCLLLFNHLCKLTASAFDVELEMYVDLSLPSSLSSTYIYWFSLFFV